MKCIHNRIRVKFETTHNKIFNIGGVQLIRPDDWRDTYDEKSQENVNYLETKPQICIVLAANDKYPYKVGDRLFVHYMAHETANCGDIITNEAFIIADYVFFTFRPDGEWELVPGTYLGKQVYTPEQTTQSGLIYELGGKKENLQVQITHVPPDADEIAAGDTVLSIDKYNYEFTIYPDKYIRLTKEEIVGKVIHAEKEEAIA